MAQSTLRKVFGYFQANQPMRIQVLSNFLTGTTWPGSVAGSEGGDFISVIARSWCSPRTAISAASP